MAARGSSNALSAGCDRRNDLHLSDLTAVQSQELVKFSQAAGLSEFSYFFISIINRGEEGGKGGNKMTNTYIPSQDSSENHTLLKMILVKIHIRFRTKLLRTQTVGATIY